MDRPQAKPPSRSAATSLHGCPRVESHAPAPAEDAVVALYQRGERGARRLIGSLTAYLGLGYECQPNPRHRALAVAWLAWRRPYLLPAVRTPGELIIRRAGHTLQGWPWSGPGTWLVLVIAWLASARGSWWPAAGDVAGEHVPVPLTAGQTPPVAGPPPANR